jgi:hypothetical protein
MLREWAGLLLGGYFASMGIFSFGCAAGCCDTRYSPSRHRKTIGVEFEEVKTKTIGSFPENNQLK